MSPRKRSARDWLAAIFALPREAVKIMNVCGGHERAIAAAGLRSALPPDIELIPGPGCPVCICPEEAIHDAIHLALNADISLLAFGDMLRVPINAPRGQPRSLNEAHAAGADVRPISSPSEANAFARADPQRPFVLFATGFETTIAPIAALVTQGAPENLSVLLAGRLTWPAVAMLLESGEPGFGGLVAPGHVAAVMGSSEWKFVPELHGIPSAVAGFTTESLLAAIYSVCRQTLEGQCFLDNCYPEVVRPEGNVSARSQLSGVMEVTNASWRGIGTISHSGFSLRSNYARYDASLRFADVLDQAHGDRRRAGEMPPGCDCAQVVLGKRYPNECRLFGTACTPRQPVGPCMVSDEGACRIWWAGGIRPREPRSATG